MTSQQELLNVFITEVVNNTTIDSINIGPLPLEGGTSIEVIPSKKSEMYLNRQVKKIISVMISNKKMIQTTCYDQLCEVTNYLQRNSTFPSGLLSEWNDATPGEPFLVTKEQSGQYIYAMITELEIKQ